MRKMFVAMERAQLPIRHPKCFVVIFTKMVFRMNCVRMASIVMSPSQFEKKERKKGNFYPYQTKWNIFVCLLNLCKWKQNCNLTAPFKYSSAFHIHIDSDTYQNIFFFFLMRLKKNPFRITFVSGIPLSCGQTRWILINEFYIVAVEMMYL